MLTIRLLGPPTIERDGRPLRPPRGQKAWVLLGYLLLSDRAPSRSLLAGLVFPDADDPLGALRWSLAELRRALGTPGDFRGDPVRVALDGDVEVDVRGLTHEENDSLLRIGGELLEGMHPNAGPRLDSWLSVERHRVSALVEARLRQECIVLMATGRPGEAIAYASQAVARNPLDEGNHELLVRSLAMAGDRPAALRQVDVCGQTLRDELGVDASWSLRDAVNTSSSSLMIPPLGGRAAAVSQLDAGRAAIDAGAVEAGLQCLRRAVSEAARCHDMSLQARALSALGGALVHAVRGGDEEGALMLREAIEAADRAGDGPTAVTACRELGFVEVQAGRGHIAEEWLTRAQALATTDAELAAILGVRGMNASDHSDYPAAFDHLVMSMEHARRCADDRQQAWTLSILARAHLLRGEHSPAAVALERCLALVHQQRWIAFLPWPQALQAELDLRSGHPEAASEGFEQAWTLACQIDDPCWESMAARGLGLLSAGRGDHAEASTWFAEGAARANRVTDRYQWVRAYVLDAMITVALDHGDDGRAAALVAALESLSARCEMRELVVRARVHQHRLGRPAALSSARDLAAHIDNPALDVLLERA